MKEDQIQNDHLPIKPTTFTTNACITMCSSHLSRMVLPWLRVIDAKFLHFVEELFLFLLLWICRNWSPSCGQCMKTNHRLPPSQSHHQLHCVSFGTDIYFASILFAELKRNELLLGNRHYKIENLPISNIGVLRRWRAQRIQTEKKFFTRRRARCR